LTTYRLRFHALPLAEWQKLDGSVRTQFKKKLEERLITPRVPSAALSGMADCYKIKLRAAGYRLVYRVDDGEIWVTVISIGLREKLQAYTRAQARLDDPPRD
jgi:mRNA interferase RelE/StbE